MRAVRGLLEALRHRWSSLGPVAIGLTHCAEVAPLAPQHGATQLPAGTRLGPYTIDTCVGRGAVGAVYRAVDANGQAVALKVLVRANAANAAAAPVDADAFPREADAARRLRHPNIVAVIASGATDRLAWLALALAPGRNLQHHTQAPHLLPPATVADIGAAVATALAHAHRQGVLHRDVKPANIMFDAASSSVQLTDFGTARIAATTDDAGSEATRSGLLMGTVAYMPPEQLLGAPLGPASDLYALGATLFHLLTGQLPHAADSLACQMKAIQQAPAPDVRSLRPALDAEWAPVLARLLAKPPAQRGGDGDVLAAQLRALAARLRAPPPGTPAGSGPAADPGHNSVL